MEEALGKLDISEEEATPPVINDLDDDVAPKWLLAGKVLLRNLFHIQTITNACVQLGVTRGAWSFGRWEKTCLSHNLHPSGIVIAFGMDPPGT